MFIFVGSPIILRPLSESNSSITYNIENSDLFSKVSLIKNNHKIETMIVVEENTSYSNDTRNIIKQINSSPIYNYFVPGEIFSCFDSLLLKSIFSSNENKVFDKKYSLLKLNYKNFNFSNFSNDDYENALALRPSDENPLFLNTVEYERLLLENINKIYSNKIDFVDLSDKKYIDNLISILSTKPNWKGKISLKEINTLKALLGIDTIFNQLFYYQRDYIWLSQKTPNLLNMLEKRYNLELSKLLSFLWTSEITQNNIYNSFNEIDPIFGNVNNFYPTIKVLSEFKQPNSYDIDFIKNDLVRYNEGVFSYLNSSGNYTQTTLLQEIDPSIIDKASWDLYVLKNTMSLSDAKLMIDNLSSKLNNLSFFQFSNNKINLNKYSYFLKTNNDSYLTNSEIYVTVMVFLNILLLWISLNKFRKLNYKIND